MSTEREKPLDTEFVAIGEELTVEEGLGIEELRAGECNAVGGDRLAHVLDLIGVPGPVRVVREPTAKRAYKENDQTLHPRAILTKMKS